jgi:rod shape determining protein RodA
MLELLTTKVNFRLVTPSIIVFILGYTSIVSTTQGLAENHLLYFFIGLIIFSLLQYIDVPFFVKYSIYFYIFVSFLLILIFIIGHTALGASRWLKIGELSLQPSEMAKIAVIFLNTKLLIDETGLKIYRFVLENKFLKTLIFTLPLIFMVLIQPDLGTTISIGLIYLGIILISDFNKIWFLLAFAVLGIASTPLYNSLQDYQKDRIVIFMNPESDPYGNGYNSIQAKIAVGSGGFFGKGYKQGTQTQLNFLPIFWTDFLVATYAEEWGFIGLLFFLVTYLFLIYEMYSIFIKTSSPAFKYISFGILVYFSMQFLINFGMNIGLLPVTGIPVPLFSYGGTSLVSSLILLGIINKISVDKSKY